MNHEELLGFHCGRYAFCVHDELLVILIIQKVASAVACAGHLLIVLIWRRELFLLEILTGKVGGVSVLKIHDVCVVISHDDSLIRRFSLNYAIKLNNLEIMM